MLNENVPFPVAETVILPSATPQVEAVTLLKVIIGAEIAQSGIMGSLELQFVRNIIISPEDSILAKIDLIVGVCFVILPILKNEVKHYLVHFTL